MLSMVYNFVLPLSLLNISVQGSADCQCGFDWQPVCSEDGNQFENPCLAECHGVEAWTEGECKDDCKCGFNYEPVCSHDGRQFDNPCLAECHGVEAWTEGECKDCSCGYDFQPVCSEDMRQFDNPCLAKCDGVEVFTDGECPQIEDVCVLQLSRKECKAVADCSWSSRKERCSYRKPRTIVKSLAQSDCLCGLDWQPVCSEDGNQFDNPCLAKCHGVEAWTEGECKDCECGFDYQPVCSEDMRQFDNPCLAKCRGVEVWTEGECPQIEDVCVLQSTPKECRSIPECAWSRRNERCSYRDLRLFISDANCDCGFDWQPVCSEDRNQFENPCLAKCHGVTKWTEGKCKDCECGFDFQPVCSDDRRQFDNPCLAECHGVGAWTKGECKENCSCGFDFQPVCSEDMRQFDNPCLAECKGVQVWTEGECPPIEDVCVLQSTPKECRSIPECAWSRRNERCSYRNISRFNSAN